MKEPLRDVNHLPMQQEVTRQESVVSLTPHVKQSQPSQKTTSQSPILSLYQRKLLAEIQKRPDIMSLFNIIFQKYPALVNREMRFTSPHATHRQRSKGRQATLERLKMESYIEETICALAGINLAQLATESVESVEATPEQITEQVTSETQEEPKPPKKATRKKTKKKAKKKVTKKASVEKVTEEKTEETSE